MMTVRDLLEGFNRWIDLTAEAAVSVFDVLRPPKRLTLIEQGNQVLGINFPDGDLSLATCDVIVDLNQEKCHVLDEVATNASGRRIDLVLQADHFLLRHLELPQGAAEFLGGVVQAQIDRLAPWKEADVLFGWSEPLAIEEGRISTTIVAAARAHIMSYVAALAKLDPHSISIFASVPGGEEVGQVKIWEGRLKSVLDPCQIRKALIMVLAAATVAAASPVTAAAIIGDTLGRKQAEIARQTAVRASTQGGGLSGAGAQQALLERKRGFPAAFEILETLSLILPDHTYVTEFLLEGNRLRLTGITRDAPSLIAIIEQSKYLKRATFYAPTTRTSSEPRERFHIEAQVQSSARS
jgi:general secretion pathway protein L